MVFPDDSASDFQFLRQKLVDMAVVGERASATISALVAEKKILTHERDAAIAQRDGALQENEKLLLILSQLQRTVFGRRSEKIDLDQLALLLAENELAPPHVAVNENTAAQDVGCGEKTEKPRPNRNRGQLPPHLPRIEVVVDVEDKFCPCCGGRLHKISESCKEMLDIVPIQYRVKRIIRPRYGCRACKSAVVQAPAPAQPIDGGMATEAFLAHIAMMKYGFHMPLYRLEQMFAAQGIDLNRQTLALWMGRAAWWLKPLHELLLATVLTYPKLFADETPLPMLDPGRGKTKRCQFWAVATDDRPWAGPAPPAVVYVFAEDRKGQRAREIFAGFSGVLQVDGYAGYNGLVRSARAGGTRDARLLLRPCPPQVLRRPCRHRIDDRGRSAGADQPVLRRRSAHSRPVGRRTPRGSASRNEAAHRRLQALARSTTDGNLPKIGPRQGDPLCAGVVGGADALPRRWANRARQQCGRAQHASHCTWKKESSVRRQPPRRRNPGDFGLAHQHMQIERNRPASLSRRRAGARRLRTHDNQSAG